MAKTISASVGLNGVNRANDVTTVQQLLNNVPKDKGGPQPLLVLDGICGPKTRGAIQAFQLHHFGWSGADGRVDPGHQTLAKLNEFDTPTPKPPPPVPPKEDPASMDFVIIPGYQGEVFHSPWTSSEFTYLVVDVTNSLERLYQLQFGVGAPPSAGPFQGFASRFHPNRPRGVSSFEGLGVYTTTETGSPHPHPTSSIRSTLNLFPPQGGTGISIPMKTHLYPKSASPGAGTMTSSRDGKFKIVR